MIIIKLFVENVLICMHLRSIWSKFSHTRFSRLYQMDYNYMYRLYGSFWRKTLRLVLYSQKTITNCAFLTCIIFTPCWQHPVYYQNLIVILRMLWNLSSRNVRWKIIDKKVTRICNLGHLLNLTFIEFSTEVSFHKSLQFQNSIAVYFWNNLLFVSKMNAFKTFIFHCNTI